MPTGIKAVEIPLSTYLHIANLTPTPAGRAPKEPAQNAPSRGMLCTGRNFATCCHEPCTSPPGMPHANMSQNFCLGWYNEYCAEIASRCASRHAHGLRVSGTAIVAQYCIISPCRACLAPSRFALSPPPAHPRNPRRSGCQIEAELWRKPHQDLGSQNKYQQTQNKHFKRKISTLNAK